MEAVASVGGREVIFRDFATFQGSSLTLSLPRHQNHGGKEGQLVLVMVLLLMEMFLWLQRFR